MKTITNEQIQTILDELLRLNIPVQSYNAIRNLLATLPEVKEDGK